MSGALAMKSEPAAAGGEGMDPQGPTGGPVTAERPVVMLNSWLPRSLKTLVVDDDDGTVADIEEHLAKIGAGTLDVTRVRTLDEAWAALDRATFSLVLASVDICHDDTTDVATELNVGHGELPIIVYGAATQRARIARSMDGGAKDHLVLETLDTDRVSRAVRYVLDTRRYEMRLQHVAHYDSLTGLANRALFQDRVSHALARAKRSEGKLALLLLDLDRFKLVNDSLGHMAGDMLLSEVAGRLNTTLRTSDTVARLDTPLGTVARLGGDEFAILIEDAAHERGAVRVAERMLESLRDPIAVGADSLTITTSIGIAIYPDDAGNLHDLLRCADVAMYQAKQRGRHNYQLFNEQLHTAALGRMRAETALRSALAQDEFVLHYQPQHDLRTNRTVGVEALLRWQQGERLVPPGEFIGLLEETGLIAAVGEWVLRESCRELAASKGRGPGYVAVNLSPRQFEQDTLVQQVRSALDDSGLQPNQLELEITEGVLMRDQEQSLRVLHELKSVGVRLALDDFGTGYSSLAYLKDYPVDVLKIDRAFVRDIDAEGNGAALAAAIIQMGHTLDLKVLAEAVETKEQLEFLRGHNCDMAQGFLLGRPEPFDSAIPPRRGD